MNKIVLIITGIASAALATITVIGIKKQRILKNKIAELEIDNMLNQAYRGADEALYESEVE